MIIEMCLASALSCPPLYSDEAVAAPLYRPADIAYVLDTDISEDAWLDLKNAHCRGRDDGAEAFYVDIPTLIASLKTENDRKFVIWLMADDAPGNSLPS